MNLPQVVVEDVICHTSGSGALKDVRRKVCTVADRYIVLKVRWTWAHAHVRLPRMALERSGCRDTAGRAPGLRGRFNIDLVAGGLRCGCAVLLDFLACILTGELPSGKAVAQPRWTADC